MRKDEAERERDAYNAFKSFYRHHCEQFIVFINLNSSWTDRLEGLELKDRQIDRQINECIDR